MYPSQHEIHEAYGVYVDRELMEISKQRLNALSHGIIGELMDEGYSTYILSANPFLSPLYGFTKYTENLITGYDYTPYKKYNEYVEYEKLQSMTKDHGYIGTALKLIKGKKLSLLNKAIKFYIKRRITKLATKLGIYDPTMEKRLTHNNRLPKQEETKRTIPPTHKHNGSPRTIHTQRHR
jgi:hypothetical protein